MRVTDDMTGTPERAPALLPRRSFFARMLVLAAGMPLVGAALRGVTGRAASAPQDGPSVSVRINPLAVPRTSKGSTRHG